MGDDEKKPLVEISSDVLGVGKATEALTDKLARAAGVLYEPRRIRLKSKEEREAERDAALTRARTAIEVADLEQRATFRRRYEEIREQANLEAILDKATSQMSGNNVAPEKMDDDWVNQFVNKAKLVSKEEMQDWWAKIFAFEAQNSGHFSPKTLEIVSVMRMSDAELFANLCHFVVTPFGAIGRTDGFPLIFGENAGVYKKGGVDFKSIRHLSYMGLVLHTRDETVITLPQLDDYSPNVNFTIDISGRNFSLSAELQAGGPESLVTGRVSFTRAGLELSRICDDEEKHVPEFPDFVIEEYKKRGLVFKVR